MRNKFTFRFTLILLFCTCFLSIAQSKFGDKRVLPIDDIFKTWNILKDFKVDVSMDSSQSSNGNYSALVSCSKNHGEFLEASSINISKYIPIDTISENMQIKLRSRSNFDSDFNLKVFCINKNEDIDNSDSMKIPVSNEWKEITLKINTHSAKAIYIQIKGTFTKGNKKTEVDVLKLWIDKVNIKMFNKSQTVNSDKQINCENYHINNPISLSYNNDSCIDEIKEFESHKIIGLAETTHGSETINKSVCQIIRRLIEKKNCKLILVELPFNLVMTWNNYIQGNDNIDIGSLVNRIPMLFSQSQMIDLLKWIKQYNKLSTKAKVSIIGFDLNGGINMVSTAFTYEAISSQIIDSNLTREIKDSLFFNLDNNYKKFNYVKRNKYLAARIGADLYNNLLFSLNTDMKFEQMNFNVSSNEYRYADYYLARDSLMYLNIKFAIDKYLAKDEKAIIYGHFTHLNKFNTQLYELSHKSMGSYLTKKWGKEYFVTALTVGEGEITNFDEERKYNNQRLMQSPSSSIEFYCNNKNIDYLFCNIDSLNRSCQIRAIYNKITSCKQFNFINPKRRIDAVIYMKRSMRFVPSEISKTFNSSEYYYNLIYKYINNK